MSLREQSERASYAQSAGAQKSNQGCDVGSGTTCADPCYAMPEILKSAYTRRQELQRQQYLIEQRLMVVNAIIDAFGS